MEEDGVPFTVDYVVFTLKELMQIINQSDKTEGIKILFDEPQVSIGSRDFQSIANKIFNHLLTTLLEAIESS